MNAATSRLLILPLILLVTAACYKMAPSVSSTRRSPWSSFQAIGSVTYYDSSIAGEVAGVDMSLEYEAVFLKGWKEQLECIQQASQSGQGYDPSLLSMLFRRQWMTDKRLLDLATSEDVVVHVIFDGTNLLLRSSSEFWEQQTQEELVRRITLVVDGSRISPFRVQLYDKESVHFRGRDFSLVKAFHVFFPRTVNGQPLLTPNTRKFYLEIADPNLRVRLPFDVSRMIVNGELVY